ncbi:RNA polymerase II mediator complex subunit [Candida orthopsilosis Co 90-125]|uniref:Mediator of RNA polymerase II transcription subunit 7 n=1 Tax=Candida orthopsilosis (strain 90-125) TaxID=1136231 RepID=H8X181_CANO9|nr:RNA polymerase II mediator complex subunit [Candida orthopsilosis Co 90-125]CCG22121.1 RNA polymerase II mediator complex subunit [Candida orthopsilosis Co 90-125]
MSTSNSEDLISSLYPPPPPFVKFFTGENLAKLEEIRKTTTAIESEEGDVDSGEHIKGELKLLVPPEVPSGSQYRGYGNIWSFKDKLPNLKDTQWKQLYNDANLTSETKIKELHKMMDSLLLNFVELINILSVDPQQFEPKIKDMSLLLINFNHILNTYRPHQSRESLIMLLKRKIQAKRAEIENIESVCEDVKSKIIAMSNEDIDMNVNENDEKVVSDYDGNIEKDRIVKNLLSNI